MAASLLGKAHRFERPRPGRNRDGLSQQTTSALTHGLNPLPSRGKHEAGQSPSDNRLQQTIRTKALNASDFVLSSAQGSAEGRQDQA